EAVARASEAMAMEELSSLEWVAAGLVDLGALHVRRGDDAEAERILESLRTLESSEHVQIRASYLAILAEVLAGAGRAKEAVEVAERVVGVRSQISLTDQSVKRALVRGIEAAFIAGDDEKAGELLQIVERARPGQVTPYLR